MRTLLRVSSRLLPVLALVLWSGACFEMELLDDPAVSEPSSLPSGTTDTGGVSTTDGVTTPTDGVTTPTDGVTTPTDGVTTPTDGVTTPTDGVTTPTDGVTTPTDGVTTPTDSGTTTVPPATLRIVHAAFGQGPVDIWIDGQAPAAESPLAGLDFGESTGWLELTPGTIDVAVAVAGTSDAADAFFSIDGFELAADSRQTLWAYGKAGEEGDEGFDIGVLAAPEEAPAAEAVDLTVAHAALSVGPVDLVDGADAPLLEDIAFGASAALLLAEVTGVLPVGIDADATEGTDLRFLPDLSPFAGEALLVIAVGDLEDGEFGVQLLVVPEEGDPVLLTPEVPEPAQLRLLHGTMGAPDVVLWIDGERVDASVLSPREGTLVEGIAPGEAEVVLRIDEENGDALWTETITFAEGGSYALWTWGDFDDTFFPDNNDIRVRWADLGAEEPTAADELRFGLFIGVNSFAAPDSSDYRLDVGETEGVVEVEGAGSLGFSAATFASGSYELTVVREAATDIFFIGGGDTLYGPDTYDLGTAEGVVLVVLSGNLDSPSTSSRAARVLVSLPDGSVLEPAADPL